MLSDARAVSGIRLLIIDDAVKRIKKSVLSKKWFLASSPRRKVKVEGRIKSIDDNITWIFANNALRRGLQ